MKDIWAITKDRLDVYGQLMRVEKPIGTLLLLWPTYWALWIASKGNPDWVLVLMFTLGTFFMRSAGCVANDLFDRDIDGAVERTKNRPFALGRVSKTEAVLLIVILFLLSALCLLPMNRLTWLMSLPALFLAITYPLTKRFFPMPQLYLGLAFTFGVPMAFTAQLGEWPPAGAWVIFTAGVFWTLAYDTIYALVDKPDDIHLNITSTALTWGRYDVAGIMICHAVFTGLMVLVGYLLSATWPYWVAVGLVVVHQVYQYTQIKGRDRAKCFKQFLQNNQVGMLLFAGLIFHYLVV
ncbi:MAG: 4-hydroxybenzoate octaprenyltransferase [Neisseriaceae bacterium]|nr:4-hydroxybenzoate octaprenyltransferase [Neisseriaceae bacterium]MBP6861479.1 4-hydroxybenzoate octaprenyltransferase [Neisseriaceae bacterium]